MEGGEEEGNRTRSCMNVRLFSSASCLALVVSGGGGVRAVGKGGSGTEEK